MSYMRLSEGGFRAVYPPAKMGHVQPELSRSSRTWHEDLTFVFTFIVRVESSSSQEQGIRYDPGLDVTGLTD